MGVGGGGGGHTIAIWLVYKAMPLHLCFITWYVYILVAFFDCVSMHVNREPGVCAITLRFYKFDKVIVISTAFKYLENPTLAMVWDMIPVHVGRMLYLVVSLFLHILFSFPEDHSQMYEFSSNAT